MTYYCADVKLFHDKFDLVTPPHFQLLSPEQHHFRSRFFHEEYNELYEAGRVGNLPDAIDALIDLVYITCGCALLYGIMPNSMNSIASNLMSDFIYHPANDDLTFSGPHLLPADKQRELLGCLACSIIDYEHAWEHKDEARIKTALGELYVNCMFGAADMGFTESMWNALWDDVQRANMTKQRATSAAESKRGSAFDVIKPPGWVGPRTTELVMGFIQAVRS